MHEGTVTTSPRTQVIIKRPRLTRLLDEAGARIILLLAPAGYGKTTLAREWTGEQERVGWYTGGPAMIDVAGFSVGLAETLAAMGTTAHNEMLERVRILAARGHDARGLAKAVSGGAPGADWVLVVDDYHHALGSADAEAFFEELVGLTQFRLLITSRERPSWLAARSVVYGEAAVVEMDALAFTDDEARAVLGGGDAEEIVVEARGWPAVIGLAAMRGGATVAAGLPPDDLYRFFAEDLFRSASPQLREAMFLLSLAGVDGARALLGRSHVELVAEAAERGFLAGGEHQAVHPLLKGFLLAKLREFDDAKIQATVANAVDYLAGEHRWDDCLSALEQFPDDKRILSALELGLAEILDSGRVVTLSSWLALARRRDLRDPLLLLAEAEVGLRRGAARKAQVMGEEAGDQLEHDLAARAYLAAARGAHLRDVPSEVSRLCDLAVARATDTSTRIDALWTAFASALERGETHASDVFSSLQGVQEDGPAHRSRLLTATGLLLCQRGRVRDGLVQMELAREFLPRIDDPFVRTNLLHHLSYVHLLAADYSEAISAAGAAIKEGRETGLEFVVDHGLLRMSGACTGMRRLGHTQRALQELSRRSDSASDFVVSNTSLQRVRLAITVGDLTRASTLLAAHPVEGGRPAFQGEVRAYRAIVAASLRDHEGARQALNGDEACFEFVESSALREVARSIIAIQSGKRASVPLANLRGLITRGELDAIVIGARAFPELARTTVGSDLHIPMTGLLARSRDFDLAKAVGLKVARESRPKERLSSREQEVYELLAQGRTNHEIAKALFISDSTTKVHVRHIFEKLGVHSRAEAAAWADLDDGA